MALHHGPIVFLTDGTSDSLSALPPLLSLAGELDCRLNAVYVDPTAAPEQAPRALPDGAITARIRAAAPASQPIAAFYSTSLEQLPAALRLAAEGSASDGLPSGFAVLRAAYRGRLGRLFSDNTHADLLRRGTLPLMVLPVSGTLDPLRRILFPADLSPRSDAALDAAIDLCRTLAAELHVLHVYGNDRLLPAERDQARRAAARSPLELLRIDQQRLAALVERARARNVRAVAHTAEGRAHTEIVKYSLANSINAIVMPSHGPRTLEDLFFGSTTLRVIQRASVPVLALRGTPAHQQPPFEVDQSPG